jgi:dihydrofolate reductase
MGKVILGVTISLDGFAEDSSGNVGALYPDLEVLGSTGVMKESIRNTGAVVMAWKEFAMSDDQDWYAGNYEYQVPIFVVGNRVPQKHPKETETLTFHFVTDEYGSAVDQARSVAGDKDIIIIGSAHSTHECLTEGLADELHLDIIPIFLHDGFRPFEGILEKTIRLKRIKVVELPAGRIHTEFQL